VRGRDREVPSRSFPWALGKRAPLRLALPPRWISGEAPLGLFAPRTRAALGGGGRGHLRWCRLARLLDFHLRLGGFLAEHDLDAARVDAALHALGQRHLDLLLLLAAFLLRLIAHCRSPIFGDLCDTSTSLYCRSLRLAF